MKKLFFLLIIVAIGLSSCAPNRMFKTPKDYEFAKDTSGTSALPFKIQAGDHLQLKIFSNDGFKLVDVTQGSSFGYVQADNLEYIVEETGEVKLPVVGRINMQNMTVKEAENMLQQKYSQYYNDPFILLKITNRHAIVFIGESGKGTLVPLTSDNSNLFEVLAISGGISEFSHAYHIKILRGDLKNPQIFKADISTPEALKNSELRVYSNDIIYVDSGFNLSRRLTTEVVPILGIFTSLILIFTTLTK